MKLITITGPPSNPSFNVYRKLYHLLGLAVPVAFYLGVFDPIPVDLEHRTRAIGFCLLVFGIVVLLGIDLGRFLWPAFRKRFYDLLGPLMKEEERHRINASVPYFLANVVLFAFFGREVTVIACIFLMIGDPVAAYVGGRYGRVRFWNGKSLEGMLGFSVAGSLGSLIFLGLHTLGAPAENPFVLNGPEGFRWQVLLLVFLGAVVAAGFEFFAFNRFMGFWDDNLSVPLAGAVGIALLAFYLFGFPAETLFFQPTELFAPLSRAAALGLWSSGG